MLALDRKHLLRLFPLLLLQLFPLLLPLPHHLVYFLQPSLQTHLCRRLLLGRLNPHQQAFLVMQMTLQDKLQQQEMVDEIKLIHLTVLLLKFLVSPPESMHQVIQPLIFLQGLQ
jgi:hypothetical protein